MKLSHLSILIHIFKCIMNLKYLSTLYKNKIWMNCESKYKRINHKAFER